MKINFAKSWFFLVKICLFTSITQAQKVPVSISPNPNAASLGMFANLPNLKSSGTPDINVPIEQLSLRDFELPVSLRYNASGIKTTERASWVGLGWVLEAGGVITRVVNGKSDEIFKGRLSPIKGSTTAIESENLNLNNDEETICNTLFNKFATAQSGGYSYNETEPDVFYMNFAGLSGKFILDKNGTPSLIPYQNLKISYKKRDVDSAIISFKVIDTKGNQYFFEDYEFTNSQIDASQYVTALLSDYRQPSRAYENSSTSWYLTKIITVKGESMKFYYEKEYPIDIDQYEYSLCVRNMPDNADPFYEAKLNYPQLAITTISQDKTYSLRLSRIETEKNILQFDGIERIDYYGKALSKISFLKKLEGASQLMRSYELQYSYFDCKYDFSISVPQGKENEYYKKLRLDKLIQLDSKNAKVGAFQFSYDQDFQLPSYKSKEQDIWGYYNLNGAKVLIPRMFIYPHSSQGQPKYSVFELPDSLKNGLEFILSGANRSSNPATITAGMLKTITFPTGGSATYTFEAHDFDFYGKKIIGGGVRLKQYSLFDGISHGNDIVRDYKYEKNGNSTLTSGVLFDMPVFAYIENTHGYNYFDGTNTINVAPNNFNEYSKEYYQYFLTRVSLPRYNLNGLDGGNIIYSEISEINKDNSKTIYNYSTPGRFGQSNDNILSGCSELEHGSCDNLFAISQQKNVRDVVFWKSIYGNVPIPSLDERGMGPDGYSFPFAPNTNYEWNRGKLLNQKVFDYNNKLVKETKYTYQLFIPGNGIKMVYGIKFIPGHNWKLTPNQNPNSSSAAPYFTLAKYKYISNVDKVLASKEERSYDKLQDTYVSNKIAYFYNNSSYNFVSKEEQIRGDGSKIIKKYVYPFDIANPYPSSDPYNYPLSFMVYNNIIDKPLEVVTLLGKNGKEEVIHSELMLFSGHSVLGSEGISINIPLPKKKLVLQTNKPLTDYLAYRIGYEGYEEDYFDSRFKTEEDYMKYDSRGNLSQYSLKDSKLTFAYLWDDTSIFPTTEAKNSELSDLAFTDFETTNSGGWVYANNYIYTSSGFFSQRSYSLEGNGQINKIGLDPNKKYLLTLYFKDDAYVNGLPVAIKRVINGWNYGSIEVTAVNSVNIDGDGLVDYLLLHPIEASVSTYSYEMFKGLTSRTDARGETTYYEYDDFQRLKHVKDQNGYIIKKFDYHFKP